MSYQQQQLSIECVAMRCGCDIYWAFIVPQENDSFTQNYHVTHVCLKLTNGITFELPRDFRNFVAQRCFSFAYFYGTN